MRFGNSRLGALAGRPALVVLLACAAAIAMIACRGGGAAPSGSPVIPVLNPTVGPSECANSIYPPNAPPFAPADQLSLTTTASGLGYVIHQEGSGDSPGNTSPVVVRYTGWLSDGCVFDSSFLRNPNSSTFSLAAPLIEGWKEALLGMQVGEQRTLVIPPNLGYGPLGSAPRIPPNATLIFYVELVEILAPAEATATVEARASATADARATQQARAEATATAFSGGVPATATPTITPGTPPPAP